MSFFKAYDMRGTYGVDFDLDTVYRVGRWLPSILGARTFLVGRDMRLTSEAMRDALVNGLVDAGADVDDMGLSTTPMVYFFTAKKRYDASVQITASHNPASDNGMKVSSRGALPVGGETGLKLLEERVMSGKLLEIAPRHGVARLVDYRREYIDWMKSRMPSLDGLRFAVDCSDGASSILVHDLFSGHPDLFGTQAFFLNDTPNGEFPHHAPNPLLPEARAQAAELVRRCGLDCAAIFDGDADRVMFLDEHGNFIQPDYFIPILARSFGKKDAGSAIIHDIRTSRGAIEALRADGFKPVIGKVGHAFAKLLLRETKAVCGGELAGHYYFRDFVFCDSGIFAALLILGALAAAKARGVSCSQLMAPIMKYASTGEWNFKIDDKAAAVDAACAALKDLLGKPCQVYDFDGVRIEFKDGWANLRPSNTEAYLRAIVEAKDANTLEKMCNALKKALAPFILEPCSK